MVQKRLIKIQAQVIFFLRTRLMVARVGSFRASTQHDVLINKGLSKTFLLLCRGSISMSNTSSNLIISGVLLTIIGFMRAFADSIMAGALPRAMLSTLSSIKVYIFEPMLVIGIILLVIGIILYTRRPTEI